MSKKQFLLIIASIYILSYIVGFFACSAIDNFLIRALVFDVSATIVTFAFSVIYRNSSVYDAYWSLTPMIMSIWFFVEASALSFWNVLFLIVFNLWSARLTINWMTVTSGFSYEDWRYRKFRDENNAFFWFFINFFGIHMMPTLIVFAGMLPLFEIAHLRLTAACIPGLLLILSGVALEYFADREMHAFLIKKTSGKTCRLGLWKYSRHPNYLGEITVWLGTYLCMLPHAPEKWYLGVGALAIAIMFNIISIPLMEKRQRTRRADYADYQKTTSRLLLLPEKKR